MRATKSSGLWSYGEFVQHNVQACFESCFGNTPRDNFLKKLIIVLLALIGFGVSALHSEEAAKPEPNAKDIPKPVLMLGLFCNSAMVSIKGQLLANPRALPWRADGTKERKIAELLNKLDPSDAGYVKSVKDGALTEGEAKFLKFKATHEAIDWAKNISRICNLPADNGGAYEQCLQEVNSEIFKCYRQIMEQAK